MSENSSFDVLDEINKNILQNLNIGFHTFNKLYLIYKMNSTSHGEIQ